MQRKLDNFLSLSTEIRIATTKDLEDNPVENLLGCCQVIDDPAVDSEKRGLASILARSILKKTSPEVFDAKTGENGIPCGVAASEVVVNALSKETLGPLRSRLEALIAEFCESIYRNDPTKFGSLWTYMNICHIKSSQGDEEFRLRHLSLLRCLVNTTQSRALDAIALDPISHISVLQQALTAGEKNLAVAMEGVKVYVSLVTQITRKGGEVTDQSSPIMNSLLSLSKVVCALLEVLPALEVLPEIIDLTEVCPKIWKTPDTDVFQAVVNLTQKSDSMDTLQLSSKLLAVVCTECEWARRENFLPTIEICMKMLTFETENPGKLEEWENRREDATPDEPGPETVALAGVDALYNLCSATSFELQQLAISKAAEATRSAEPGWRCAGFRLLSVLSQSGAFKSQITPILGNTVDLTLKGFHDQHPFVRYCAINVLSDLLENLSPLLQLSAEHYTPILRSLHNVVEKDSSKRCKKKVLVCFCHFVGGLTQRDGDLPEELAPIVEETVLKSLLGCLNTPSIEMNELGIELSALLSEPFPEFIVPHYASFRQMLIQIFSDLVVEKVNLIQSAVEFVGQLAVADKKEFQEDAKIFIPIMENLLTTSRVESFLPVRSSVFLSLSRIAESLADEFGIFFPLFEAEILSSIRQETKTEVSSQDAIEGKPSGVDYSSDSHSGNTTIVFNDRTGSHSLQVNVVAVEEKAVAITLIGTVLENVAMASSDLHGRLFHLLLPEVDSNFILIRQSASFALGHLIGTCDPRMVPQCYGPVMERLIQRLPVDNFKRASKYILPTIRKVLERIDNLTVKDYPEVCKFIPNVTEALLPSLEPHVSVATKLSLQLEPEHEAENLTDNDGILDQDDDPVGDILDDTMQICRVIFKMYEDSVVDVYTKHLQPLYSLLLASPDVPVAGRVSALCISAFYINYCGPKTHSHAKDFFPVSAIFSTWREDVEDEESETMRVQAAAFGLGVVLDKVPQLFTSAEFPVSTAAAVQLLKDVIKNPKHKLEHRRKAYDCAVSGLLKAYKTHQQNLEPAVVTSEVKALLHLMPLSGDIEEAFVAHALLIDFYIESGIIGPESAGEVQRILCEIKESLDLEEDEDSSGPLLEGPQVNKLNILLQKMSN